jgi:hypothetical protein
LLLAAVLALASAILAWLLLPKSFQTPYFLSITITAYKERHFPVNHLAQQDSAALREFFAQAEHAYDYQDKTPLTKVLEGLKTQARKPVVVHLSALSLRRGDEVYLLPADAHPDNPATWLPLTAVLEAIRACPARQKLVLLDIARPLADPRLGTLADDVAERVDGVLQNEVRRNEEANQVLFLCACRAGQAAHVSEELGQSVFGYYLSEGLRGQADGQGGGKANARVTVRELAAFVAREVERWVGQNRAAAQTPILLGEGDFELTLASANREARANPPAEDDAGLRQMAWKAIEAGWQLRDRWWDQEVFRFAPQAYRQLEAVLLRAEERWRGGIASDQVEKDLAIEISGLEQLEKSARASLPVPKSGHSLALAAALGAKQPATKEKEALQELLKEAEKPEKPKDSAPAGGLLPPKLSEWQKKYEGNHFALAWLVLEVAVAEDKPSLSRIRLLKQLLEANQARPQFAETFLLRRLAAWKKEQSWPAPTARLALQVVVEEEKAAAGAPRVLPWMRKAVDAATADRRAAERLLFAEDPAATAKAHAIYREVADRLRRINGDVREPLQKAYRCYDEALVLLPGIVPYLVRRTDPDGGAERDWTEAVRLAQQMGAKLASPREEEAEQAARDISQDQERLQFLLNKLGRQFRNEVERRSFRPAASAAEDAGKEAERLSQAIVLAGADAMTWLEMQALLSAPFWTGTGSTALKAKDRAALWAAERELARQLLRKPAGSTFRVNPAVASGRARLQARCLLELFRLGGLTGLGELEADLEKATAWPPLAAKLQAVWIEQLPTRLRTAGDPASKERLSRLVHPFDFRGRAGENVTLELRRAEVRSYWGWLGQRCEEEDRALGGSSDLYYQAAGDYLRLTR